MIIKKTYILFVIILLITGILVWGYVSVTGRVSETIESTAHTTNMLANQLDADEATVEVPEHYERKYFERMLRIWRRSPEFDERSFDVSVIQ